MAANPFCSIIIVSYNNFTENTLPCLQSLLSETADFEIIIVDNNSTDDTRQKLRLIAKTDRRIRLLLNSSNRGYAGGNNDGVKLATSEMLILLNNDTIVPAGSVTKLTNLLIQHPEWQMLGPVTNSCGNEQQIFCKGQNTDEILAEGMQWCSEDTGFSCSTDTLGFFAVAMPKHVYTTLSGLNEAFGLGFYEDTDFCHRACSAGMQLMITEDVFIYHQGSSTFSKMKEETRRLMKRNRKLFKELHGTLPTGAHVREKNMGIIAQYRDIILQGKKNSVTQYRAINRLQTAAQLLPNNPLKKFFYTRKLHPLSRFFIDSKAE